MSVTGPAQSAVDWVNPVNWGPWGPLAVTQGVAPGVPRRWPAPEQRRRPKTRRRRSGPRRNPRTGHRSGSFRSRSKATAAPRPTVVVVAAGVTGIERGELVGGRPESDARGKGDAAC